MSAAEVVAQARSIIAHGDNATYPSRSAAQHVRTVMQKLVDQTEELEKKVYIPGQWRCPKCNFRLTQSNLYVASGTVGPRDEAGDKCPNCNRPLWRVSAMQDRNEAYQCANDTFERVEKLRAALTEICRIHDQNAPQGALRADFQHIARRALEKDDDRTAGKTRMTISRDEKTAPPFAGCRG